MSVHHTCGNCTAFVRIRDWGNTRNGICDKFDWSCSINYGKSCQHFNPKRYNRREHDKNAQQEINALVR